MELLSGLKFGWNVGAVGRVYRDEIVQGFRN